MLIYHTYNIKNVKKNLKVEEKKFLWKLFFEQISSFVYLIIILSLVFREFQEIFKNIFHSHAYKKRSCLILRFFHSFFFNDLKLFSLYWWNKGIQTWNVNKNELLKKIKKICCWNRFFFQIIFGEIRAFLNFRFCCDFCCRSNQKSLNEIFSPPNLM